MSFRSHLYKKSSYLESNQGYGNIQMKVIRIPCDNRYTIEAMNGEGK
jgi:hypothetical protein